jgi:type VI secretion system secreted protein VgrG
MPDANYGDVNYFNQESFFFECGKGTKFKVVRFTGHEALSELFEFDITLVTEEKNVNPKDLILNPATLFLGPKKKLPKKGIIAAVELISESEGFFQYRVLLVPAIWKLSLHRRNRIFNEMKVDEFINKILQDHGLSATISRSGSARPWTYVTQFQETDLDFFSRWLERDGMYFFWEADGKLKIVNNRLAHTKANNVLAESGGGLDLIYRPDSGLGVARSMSEAFSFMGRTRPVPKEVMLLDYDYRKSDPEVRGSAQTFGELANSNETVTEGDHWIFGEHYRTDEVGALATVRAQELACRAEVFQGESSCPMLLVGSTFVLQKHFMKAYNQEYLITRINHEGSQAFLVTLGADVGEEGLVYRNSFEAVPNSVQWRPERRTPKPRIYGTVNGKITGTASGGENYPLIDEFGQYKVWCSYDYSGKDSKYDRTSRIATPYTGPQYGFHFPLQVNNDVLLTFIEGDIDRPIISGSVWTAKNKGVLVDKDNDKSRLKTYNNNFLEMADTKDNQYIHLETVPKESKTQLSMGKGTKDKNFTGVDGFTLRTEANSEIEIKGESKETVFKDSTMTIKQNYTTEVDQDRKDTVKQNHEHNVTQNHTQKVDGNQKRDITGDQTVKVMGKKNLDVMNGRTTSIMNKDELTVTGQATATINGKAQLTVNGPTTATLAAPLNLTMSAGCTITNGANETTTNGGPVTNTFGGPVTQTYGGPANLTYGSMATLMYAAMVQVTQAAMAIETNNGTLMLNRNIVMEKISAMAMLNGQMFIEQGQMKMITQSMMIIS